MEKSSAGYHLLMLLTMVDEHFNAQEDLVIREYLIKEFAFSHSLDKDMDIISSLAPDEYDRHFQQQMDRFYLHSTREERLHFLNFCMQLIKADGKISREENRFFDILFDAWSEE